MKSLFSAITGLLVVGLILPSFASAKGPDHRDNGLHLGQRKQELRQKRPVQFLTVRGTVASVDGTQVKLFTDRSVSSVASGTLMVDASNALIFGRLFTTMQVRDLRPTDPLLVFGGLESGILRARFILNLRTSASPPVPPVPVSFSGTISAIAEHSLDVTSNSTTYRVNTTHASLVQSGGEASTLHEFLVGDQVQVSGSTSGTASDGASLFQATLVKNLRISSTTVVRVGMNDNNRTLSLDVGDRLLLDLSNTYTWSASGANTTVLDLVRNPFMGDEGLYVAKASGSSTLTLIGDPTCRASTPACATPSVLMRIYVNVR